MIILIRMQEYERYIEVALDVYRHKGLKYLLKISIKFALLSFRGDKRDLWKIAEANFNDYQDEIIKSLGAHSKGGFDAGEVFLKRKFNDNMKGYFGIPHEYIHLLLLSIERRQIYHDFSNNYQDMLIRSTIELDPRCLPNWRWFALQYLCIRNGFFKTAYIIREKAIEIATINAKNKRKKDLGIAFRGAIDQTEFANAWFFLNQIKDKIPHQSLMELESYYYLNTGELKEFQKRKEKDFNRNDLKFLKFIKGKSVAIVGPAPSGEEHGEEIDSFDVVVRINYRRKEKSSDSREFGKRTDVSYYNMSFTRAIIESGMNYFDDLHFAVFKRIEHEAQKKLVDSGKGRKVKHNYQMINGNSFAGNVAIFDILHFQPTVVKIFNFNFYLSAIPYYPGYTIGVPSKFVDDNFTNYFECLNFGTFAHHDIISNINFTRNLWNAGLIEVDSACENVIRLSTSDYLSELEKMFASVQ